RPVRQHTIPTRIIRKREPMQINKVVRSIGVVSSPFYGGYRVLFDNAPVIPVSARRCKRGGLPGRKDWCILPLFRGTIDCVWVFRYNQKKVFSLGAVFRKREIRDTGRLRGQEEEKWRILCIIPPQRWCLAGTRCPRPARCADPL